MLALGIILARAGSKGLPDKCVRSVLGRPMIAYTFDHALASERLSAVALSTDSRPAQSLALERGIEVIERPAELATDLATVDSAARHAVLSWERSHEQQVDAVVLLYANIPVRPVGGIDRALTQLSESGASSVRTVAPVGKHHPDWLHRLEGDRLVQFRVNSIYRRQDLEPLFYHDGAVVAVTRAALFDALRTPDDAHAFFGADRRAIVVRPDESVDVDELVDLYVAEAVLRARNRRGGRQVTASTSHSETVNVAVGDRRVGPGCPAYVIAEAGVNHNGSAEAALRMIDAAVVAGVDAVKFQVFRAAELTTAAAPMAEYQSTAGAATQREMLSQLELSDGVLLKLRERCEQRGIEFLATPFGPRDVERLVGLDVRALKLASTDLNNTPLLRAAVNTGLPMIVSVGAATAAEIRTAVRRLRVWRAAERLVLLHCVSAYPTPLEAANLGAIRALEQEFGVLVGYSDHTMSVRTGSWAVAAGARVLEKHFTLDRSTPGPDHAMSLEPDGLRAYVHGVREVERALGSGRIGMTAIEQSVRSVARKSIVAACYLPAGTVIERTMLQTKRPAGGIEPDRLDELVGRTVVTDLEPDATLTWDMIK